MDRWQLPISFVTLRAIMHEKSGVSSSARAHEHPHHAVLCTDLSYTLASHSLHTKQQPTRKTDT